LIPIFLLPLYALALQPCPLLGPAFPAPTNLSSSPIFQSAKRNLTSLFQQAIATGNTTHGPLTYDVSFSLSIFSAHSASPLFQYSHTAPAFSNSSVGVRTVDENSIYRIGSVSKLLTVYLFLIEAGDTHWNDPITKYVPELAAAADSTASDAINCVDWASVTVGELASHMAGISRECEYKDEKILLLHM
jgi:CubicO group peptidase (beta-lactamase class C family)